MDYISLNDFIHGGDIAPSPYFQIYSSFLAGSSVIGRFNYWEDPIGFTRVWGIPLIFFFPPLFKSIKEDSVFYQLGVYALNNSAAWWDEVEKGLP